MVAYQSLAEVAETINGLWKGEKGPLQLINVIRNTNFSKNGRLSFDDIASIEVEAKKYARRKLLKGDIILEKSGGGPKQPVGRVAHFDLDEGEYSFSNFTSVIRIKDQKKLYHAYLHKYLHYIYVSGYTEQIQTNSTGIRNLNFDAYKAIRVPLPSLPEQQRTVAILDEAFAGLDKAISNTERNLANAREVFNADICEIFSDKSTLIETRLPAISENLDSRRKPVTKNVRSKGDIPYYGASGVVDYVGEHIFEEELLLISEDGANLLMRTYPIAFSITGKSWVNNHAHILRFSDKHTQRLVEYYLNSISLAPYVSGMAQPKLNQKSMNSIPIFLPQPQELATLVKKINELDKLTLEAKRIYEVKLASLEDLKQSLLYQAFAGELKIA